MKAEYEIIKGGEGIIKEKLNRFYELGYRYVDCIHSWYSELTKEQYFHILIIKET